MRLVEVGTSQGPVAPVRKSWPLRFGQRSFKQGAGTEIQQQDGTDKSRRRSTLACKHTHTRALPHDGQMHACARANASLANTLSPAAPTTGHTHSQRTHTPRAQPHSSAPSPYTHSSPTATQQPVSRRRRPPPTLLLSTSKPLTPRRPAPPGSDRRGRRRPRVRWRRRSQAGAARDARPRALRPETKSSPGAGPAHTLAIRVSSKGSVQSRHGKRPNA
jgi:hypothetical protein